MNYLFIFLPTFAHCSVAGVARLAGAAVASDHVEAQGVLVAVVEPAEAFVMFWRQNTHTHTSDRPFFPLI